MRGINLPAVMPFGACEPWHASHAFEAVLVVDALALLVWWPQFRAHRQDMINLQMWVTAKAISDSNGASFFQHAHLRDLRESMRAADEFYDRRPANAGNLQRGERRVEKNPAVAAVIKRAFVDINDL